MWNKTPNWHPIKKSDLTGTSQPGQERGTYKHKYIYTYTYL